VLRTRILTALVFGPLLIAAIFLPSPFWFSAIMGALFAYGGWEYSRLCKFQTAMYRHLHAVLQMILILTGLVLLWATADAGFDVSAKPYLVVTALTALWAFSRFASAGKAETGAAWTITSSLQGLILITGAWLALTWLRYQPLGSWLILQLLVIIWVADVAAYFTGRAFGKRKLAPSISPGKTWAGVAGAAVFAPFAAFACVQWGPLPDAAFTAIVGLTLLTVVTSIGGDLFISLQKRAAGVKDSGNLLPGHGGVLDRFDSLITGSVFFVLFLMY
jgi:phosphatidate cytidylyltransferase